MVGGHDISMGWGPSCCSNMLVAGWKNDKDVNGGRVPTLSENG